MGDVSHGDSQETPLGASGEMLRVVKENEVELVLVVSHNCNGYGPRNGSGTFLASPLQHHYTALRDVGDVDPQAFRRGSIGHNLEEG